MILQYITVQFNIVIVHKATTRLASLTAAALAAAAAAGRADGTAEACTAHGPLREAVASYVAEAAAGIGRWLSADAFPTPGASLLRLAGGAPGGDGRCDAEARLLPPLLDALADLAGAVAGWNTTALRGGAGGAGGAEVRQGAFSDVLHAYNGFLGYQSAKADAVVRFAAAGGLFEGWPLQEAERLFGRLLRTAWLLFTPLRSPVLPGHCACRYAPETQSLLFDAFDRLRREGPRGFDYSLFQCGALGQEPDYANFGALFHSALEPASSSCAPADVIIRAACAQGALEAGLLAEAQSLMDAAANLMVLAADCFEHTPWTSGAGSLAPAEVFHNWALFAAGRPGPWSALPEGSEPLGRMAQGRFARPMCEADLGPTCVNARGAELALALLRGAGRAHEAFLHQCGDSYGDWRRARVWRGAPPRGAARAARAGLVLHLSPTALENLWHLLHILLPALRRLAGLRRSRGLSPERLELVLDGLSEVAVDGALGDLSRTMAGPFLRLFSDLPPRVLGSPGAGEPGWRCYEEAFWGHEAVTLFGRDKGSLGDARDAVAEVGRRLAPMAARGNQAWRFAPDAAVAMGAAGRAPDSQLPWRLLYVSRPRTAQRRVANEEDLAQLLRNFADGGRARVASVDFSA